MPKQRSPNRDKAKGIYLSSKGKKKLKDIAAELGVSDIQIRKWKNQDKWDAELKGTLPNKKSNVTNKSDTNKQIKNSSKVIEIVPPDLTDKQRLFAEIYVRNFNATQAAIKAGYASGSAFVEGSRLLKNAKVREYINELKELKKQAILLNEDDIVERYMRIAFADMTDFVEFGQTDMPIITKDGPAMIIDKDTGEEKMLTQKVNTLDFKDSSIVDGGLICEIKTSRQGTSIKLEDRQKALDWLANYFGMNPEHKYRKEFDVKKLQLERERFEHQKEMDSIKDW